MKIEWYDTRYLKCPSCGEMSPSFFYLYQIKGWVGEHHRRCGAISFRFDGYIEVVE